MGKIQLAEYLPAGFDRLGDDAGCPIIHVDMDAFFAAVELLERPDLVGRPVIVGGTEGRGVVLSATYPARASGVQAGMPMGRALALCPKATVVRPNGAAYRHYSRRVVDIIARITDAYQQLSVDEAWIDVTAATRRLGRPREIAARLRADIRAETGLPASAGVAANPFLAKLASTIAKPDGLLVLPAAEAPGVIAGLPVEALPGVGPAMRERLRRYGVNRVADLVEIGVDRARSIWGEHGAHLARLALGEDDRGVDRGDRDDKSLGQARTFPADLSARGDLDREVLRLSHAVASRLRAKGLAAGVVTLQLRHPDFVTRSRAATLPNPSDVGAELAAAAQRLLGAYLDERPGSAFRLLGVRASALSDGEARQPMLSAEGDDAARGAELASDRVVGRFGAGAITAASLLRRPERGADSAPGPRGAGSAEQGRRPGRDPGPA